MQILYRLMLASLSVLVAACASSSSEQEFSLDSGESVRFVGEMEGDYFAAGRATYADGDTVFDGDFDNKGYPRAGTLVQLLLGDGGEILRLQLQGDFNFHDEGSALAFWGAFRLLDESDRILAQSSESRWRAAYRQAHPYLSPDNFVLQGPNRYQQHRRDISVQQFVRIHRGVKGPFVVEGTYQDGKPSGKLSIATESQDGGYKAVERQYANYSLSQPVHYFYYEPGSFSEIDLLGDCDTVPNLTVPRDLMRSFAYDCKRRRFLALSPVLADVLLEISVRDLDNSGSFRRLKLYQQDALTEMEIDPDALFDGALLAEGPVLTTRDGELQFYSQYQQGRAVGIGIERTADGYRYVRFQWPESPAQPPPDSLLTALPQRYSERKAALNSVAATAGEQPSRRERAELERRFKAIIDAAEPLPGSDAVSGLLAAEQRWLHESRARLRGWQHSKGNGLSALQQDLLAMLENWRQQSRALLMEAGQRVCAAQGQSLDVDSWRCQLRPHARLRQVCLQYLGQQRCQRMAAQLGAGDAETRESDTVLRR